MLRIEHQRAFSREVESGSDWPVRRGQRGNAVPEREPDAALWLGRRGAGPAGACRAGQRGAGSGAALYREDDRPKPCAGDAADRPHTATGPVRPTVYRRCRFPGRYTPADVQLPASVDEAHETLSGPATRRQLSGYSNGIRPTPDSLQASGYVTHYASELRAAAVACAPVRRCSRSWFAPRQSRRSRA
jgi:hypothetical protein